MLIVGGAVALLTGLGVAGALAALPSGSDRGPQAFTDVSLPPYSTPATAASSPSATPSHGPTTVGTSPATTHSSPPPSPTSAPAPATTRATTAPPAGAAPEIRVSSPAPTLSAVPEADRTGAITGAGGLCLDLNGGVPADGNHVQMYECNGTAAQIWTLTSEGTLRVVGRCAGPVDDGTVRIAACDGRAAAQWRAGPNQSLVNVAIGGCLTDPANGAGPGAGVRVAGCTGAPGQHWRLP
ncbi:RICIN domain-containing protein [Actinoplanes sp. NPDC049548]|uniref:RICIN domain-containing protein n=1 Tax=Actinoplanes sp. NPDC049548 TaxID=3155152 RepID=UPI0034200322